LFQNSALYRSYEPRLRALCEGVSGFRELRRVFLHDRFGAAHFLRPVLEEDETAFFTNGDDEVLQRSWAREKGLPAQCSLADILRAQIEEHRATVFYNLDPIRYGNDFVRSLPGCVERLIAWRAAPSGQADLSGYDLVVCNFPAILRDYASKGCRTAYFFPAHDPVMDDYASNTDRPIDVLFAGSYSRHHLRRARLLEAAARLADRSRIVMHMDESRATQLAESLIGRMMPLGRYRRPTSIRRLAQPPVFGRELYSALSKSKIVINAAVDMAGEERGNMRCWEAMGLACVLVSDAGRYPQGIVAGDSFLSYATPDEMSSTILHTLRHWDERRDIAHRGRDVVRSMYSKAKQLEAFESLVEHMA
jgi:glycosyltransferase involved in cell wall biosynthesis